MAEPGIDREASGGDGGMPGAVRSGAKETYSVEPAGRNDRQWPAVSTTVGAIRLPGAQLIVNR
jgi:hypothetical protein